jgi:dipeptidyl aminopeptidase/acylaminoacyl peptidase
MMAVFFRPRRSRERATRARRIALIVAVACTPLVRVVRLGAQESGAASGTTIISDFFLDRTSIGEVTFASDGRVVAFVRARSLRATRQRFGDRGTSDVWVARAPEWTPTQLPSPTDRATTAANLTWSPDGKSLAFFRKEGSTAEVVVWEGGSRLRVVSPCLLRPEFIGWEHDWSITWLDATHLVTWADARPCRPLDRRVTIYGGGIVDAMQAWDSALAWRGATSSVITSGVPADTSVFPHAEISVIDVPSGTRRIVARGSIQVMTVSPDRTRAAILERVDFEPMHDSVAYHHFMSRFRYAARVVTLVGPPKAPMTLPVRWSAHFGMKYGSPVAWAARWSPDGTQLAILDFSYFRNDPPCVSAFDAATGARTAHVCGDIGDMAFTLEGNTWNMHHPASNAMTWVGHDELAIRWPTAGTGATQRRDWVLVHGDEAGPVLTASLPSVPAALYTAGGRTFAVSRGTLVALNASPGSATATVGDAAPWFPMTVRAIVDAATTADGDVVVRVDAAPRADSASAPAYAARGATTQCDLSLRAHAQRCVALPTPEARVVAAMPMASAASPGGVLSAVTTTVDSTQGTQAYTLTTSAPGRAGEASAHVLGVARVFPSVWITQRDLPYVSLRGESLYARVYLPPGYDSTRRYPTIVVGYSGEVFRKQGSDQRVALTGMYFDAPSLAAAGFVVLRPSMPYHFNGPKVEEALPALTNGVLPAIDAAVAAGYTDSTRVGVAGQSFGGFTVYGLLTQTSRFKAAVAMAGISSFIGEYGSVPPFTRYWPSAGYALVYSGITEDGQGDMGGPPWHQAEKYVRNSPVFLADRVTTPLLIIQGDQDIVPIEQGEQMFRALQRVGRRVEFVRYWGEGHVMERYSDIVDVYRRTVGWFEQYLR